MPNNNKQLRVLSRMGARKISPEELEQIGGSAATLLSVIRTLGGSDTQLDS